MILIFLVLGLLCFAVAVFLEPDVQHKPWCISRLVDGRLCDCGAQ